MQRALSCVSGDVFCLNDEILAAGLDAARRSPRRRIILPLHRQQEALVQRMLNFMLEGTYVRPHLHPLPYASETIHVMRGALEFLIFDEQGQITQRHHLSSQGNPLIDIEPDVWHGFMVTAPETVILEIKRGPYEADHDKVFAPWAPEEGDEGVVDFMQRLKTPGSK